MGSRRTVAAVAVAFLTVAGSASVGTRPAAATTRPGDIQLTRFLGEQRLPHRMQFAGTTVGGLSGLDRDARTGDWYLISDDRWRYNPARFYTGRLDINPVSGAFTGVRITGVSTLRQRDGSPYPEYGKPNAADPETVRFDQRTRRLLWGDEGDRPSKAHAEFPVSGPFLHWAGQDGRQLGELPLPRNAVMTDTDRGPRRNFGFEGVSVTPSTIAAILEGPRYEDGEPPTVQRGAPARITLWDRSGRVRGQYAYPLDPLPAAPNPPTGHTDSGVSEILAIDEHRYLALERSWIEGVNYKVKLYEIDLRGATNVLARESLAAGGPYRLVTKRLVANLSSFRPPVQNLESLSWGPRLATGECTLVIGSDDNFDPGEVTQFLAFGARGC